MKITIIGTGAYSLGIGLMLSKKDNNEIVLWTENKDNEIEFNSTHKLQHIFKNVYFPNNIKITSSYEDALKDTKLIFLITGAKYIQDVCNNIKPFYKDTPICIASKGIHDDTLSTLSTVVKNILKTKNICVISGPTFAIDLINNEPTALAIAGYNKKTINLVKINLQNDTLKLRVSGDIIGIELCGSIKNVIAIASGIIKGLGYSESTQAFLINESVHDIKNILYALGGSGDLLLTCTSTKSRNYSFGYIIGKNNNKKEKEKYLNNNTVEGYYALDSIYKLLKKKRVKIPLITLIYDIVMNDKDPRSLATFLITKP